MMDSPVRIFDLRMKDGSRQFADMPEVALPSEMRKIIAKLPGAEIQSFVASIAEVEAWIEFQYCGFDFAVNNQNMEYWFFVKQPECPDSILGEVAAHCAASQ